MVAAGLQFRRHLLALEDDAGLHLVRGDVERLVEQRLVGDDAPRLDAAGGGEDGLGLRIVDAGGKLRRREAAEHHRMDGAEPGAGQHGEQRLRDHRHVEDDPVALADAEVLQCRGEGRDLVEQLVVGVLSPCVPVIGLS